MVGAFCHQDGPAGERLPLKGAVVNEPIALATGVRENDFR